MAMATASEGETLYCIFGAVQEAVEN